MYPPSSGLAHITKNVEYQQLQQAGRAFLSKVKEAGIRDPETSLSASLFSTWLPFAKPPRGHPGWPLKLPPLCPEGRTRSWREWAPLKWSPWRGTPGFCLDLLGCCNTSIKEAGKYNLSAEHTGIPNKTGLLLQREDKFWMEAHKLSNSRHQPTVNS